MNFVIAKFGHSISTRRPYGYLKQLYREQLEKPNNNTSILTACNRKITAKDWVTFRKEVRKKLMQEDRDKVMSRFLSSVLTVGTLYVIICFFGAWF